MSTNGTIFLVSGASRLRLMFMRVVGVMVPVVTVMRVPPNMSVAV